MNHFYLGCVIRNDFVSSKITLVSNQKLVHILTCVTINFVQPLLNIAEALLVSYIINNLPDVEQTNSSITCKIHTKKKKKKHNHEEISYVHIWRQNTYYNAMCPTVVAASDCPEPFLPCSIPLHVSEEKIKQR